MACTILNIDPELVTKFTLKPNRKLYYFINYLPKFLLKIKLKLRIRFEMNRIIEVLIIINYYFL